MQNNKITGDKGEELAAAHLESLGYTIIERNWRFRIWEVDIIASKGNMLHFFEIKTRKSLRFGNPEGSISRKKMQNLRNAAEEYQYLNPAWKYVQFDVLAITILYGQAIEYFLIEDVYF